MGFWQTIKAIEKRAKAKFAGPWDENLGDDFDSGFDDGSIGDDMQSIMSRVMQYVQGIKQTGQITAYPNPNELFESEVSDTLDNALARVFPQNAFEVREVIDNIGYGLVAAPQPVPGLGAPVMQPQQSPVAVQEPVTAPKKSRPARRSKPLDPATFENINVSPDNPILAQELANAAFGNAFEPTDFGSKLFNLIRYRLGKEKGQDDSLVQQVFDQAVTRAIGAPTTHNQIDNRINFFLKRTEKIKENPALAARVDAVLKQNGFNGGLADVEAMNQQFANAKGRNAARELARRKIIDVLEPVLADSQPGANDGFLSAISGLLQNRDPDIYRAIASQKDNALKPLFRQVRREKQDLPIGDDDSPSVLTQQEGHGTDYIRPELRLEQEETREQLEQEMKRLGVEGDHMIDHVQGMIEKSQSLANDISTALWDDQMPYMQQANENVFKNRQPAVNSPPGSSPLHTLISDVLDLYYQAKMEVLPDVLKNRKTAKDGSVVWSNGRDRIQLTPDGRIKHFVSTERLKQKLEEYKAKKQIVFNDLYNEVPVTIPNNKGEMVEKMAPQYKRQPTDATVDKLVAMERQKWEAKQQALSPEQQSQDVFDEATAREAAKSFMWKTVYQINLTGVDGMRGPRSFMESVNGLKPEAVKESLAYWWKNILDTASAPRGENPPIYQRYPSPVRNLLPSSFPPHKKVILNDPRYLPKYNDFIGQPMTQTTASLYAELMEKQAVLAKVAVFDYNGTVKVASNILDIYHRFEKASAAANKLNMIIMKASNDAIRWKLAVMRNMALDVRAACLLELGIIENEDFDS